MTRWLSASEPNTGWKTTCEVAGPPESSRTGSPSPSSSIQRRVSPTRMGPPGGWATAGTAGGGAAATADNGPPVAVSEAQCRLFGRPHLSVSCPQIRPRENRGPHRAYLGADDLYAAGPIGGPLCCGGYDAPPCCHTPCGSRRALSPRRVQR